MEKVQENVSGKAKWTVMVYMAGDNNLDGAALRDIAEMARVGSTKDVNVLVQLDRIEDKLTRRFRIPGPVQGNASCTRKKHHGRDHLYGLIPTMMQSIAGVRKLSHACFESVAGIPLPIFRDYRYLPYEDHIRYFDSERFPRYLKVWGNHDLYWKDNEAVYQQLFPGIQIYEGIILNDTILMIHGHQADPKCSGEIASISKFFVHNFWTEFQRLGAKDPTRAATNPGLCNEVDDRLHEWATHNDKGISTIIAGHTHRAVYENLSMTERRYQESKVKTEHIKIKHELDASYFNDGSCVHPFGITGLEISFEERLMLRLVGWQYRVEGKALTIERSIFIE